MFSILAATLIFGAIISRKNTIRISAKIEYLERDGEYVIGVITQCHRSRRINGYEYVVMGRKYFNRMGDAHHALMNKKARSMWVNTPPNGSEFLVLYDRNDPARAFLYLDCPITDSTGLDHWVRWFEEYRATLKQ